MRCAEAGAGNCPLIHRELVPEDAGSLFRIYHEPDVLKYFAHGPPVSVEEERAGIIRHLGHHAWHGFGLWATGMGMTSSKTTRLPGLDAEVFSMSSSSMS